jgi:preprotein translocase subunit SecB
MENKITTYSLQEVFFPRIVGVLNKDSNITWDMLYSINSTIKSDSDIEIVLGIQLVPLNADPKEIKDFVNVEVLGLFSLGGKIPAANFVENIPLIHNLLATLYPYLREKVHSIYYANRFNYHLPSMNLINFLNENKEKFKVVDLRKQAS